MENLMRDKVDLKTLLRWIQSELAEGVCGFKPLESQANRALLLSYGIHGRLRKQLLDGTADSVYPAPPIWVVEFRAELLKRYAAAPDRLSDTKDMPACP